MNLRSTGIWGRLTYRILIPTRESNWCTFYGRSQSNCNYPMEIFRQDKIKTVNGLLQETSSKKGRSDSSIYRTSKVQKSEDMKPYQEVRKQKILRL